MATASRVMHVRNIDGEHYVPYSCYEKMMCEHENQVRELGRNMETLEKQIADLKGKLNFLRTRCHESARDDFDRETFGVLHIVGADELCGFRGNKIDTSSPIAAAQSLINHITHIPAHEGLLGVSYGETDVNTFDVDGLEQIAEHLLVYCRHNREEE